MQVDSNVVTKDDLSYLNNQVIWNESGSVIVESESDSSDEEDLIDDGKGNGKENLESLGFLKAGSVINSINLEPSILGDGKKINKGVVDGKIGYDREQVELGIDTKMQPFVGVLKGKVHRGKIDVKFMPQVDGNADGPVIIPIENLKKASLPYSNTLCGYLLDKRISFPAVQKELKRIWRNCGLEDMFMNSKGFFSLSSVIKLLCKTFWMVVLVFCLIKFLYFCKDGGRDLPLPKIVMTRFQFGLRFLTFLWKFGVGKSLHCC